MSIRDTAAEMRNGAPRLLGFRLTDEEGNTDRILYRIYEGRIEEIRVYRQGIPMVGDLCLARVVRIDRTMQLAYLEIDGIKAFLSLEHIKNHAVILQDRKFEGKLNQEDRIVVRVAADAYDRKPIRMDLHFSLTKEQREMVLHRMHTGVVFAKESIEADVFRILKSEAEARFLTEDEKLYEEIRGYREAEGAGGSFGGKIVLYRDPCIRMSNLYGLTSMLERITKERVYLSSGAQLIITPTEAFTVIDVNSARRSGKKDRADEILAINLEAAKEVAYQIGARRLGGIILVDFINMKRPDDETILTRELEEHLGALTPPGRLEDITKLGIAEITRKRTEADIYEIRALLNETILLK